MRSPNFLRLLFGVLNGEAIASQIFVYIWVIDSKNTNKIFKCLQPFKLVHIVSSFLAQIRDEPPHIHIKRDRQLAKFWLDPIALSKNRGFKEHELNDISQLVEEYNQTLVEAWHDYFDT